VSPDHPNASRRYVIFMHCFTKMPPTLEANVECMAGRPQLPCSLRPVPRGRVKDKTCAHTGASGASALQSGFDVAPPREHLTMSASMGHMAQHGMRTTLSSLGQPAMLSPTPSKTPSFGGSDSNPDRMLESAHASQLGSGSVLDEGLDCNST
jgi:hypothetical protein